MIDLLAQDGLRPFLISAFLVVGLLGLEIILMMLGLSVGPKADMPEIEAGDFEADFSGMEAADIAVEMDIDPGIAAHIETEIAAQGGDLGPDQDISQTESSGSTSALGTVLDLMGMRKLPFSLSLALFAAGFAGCGLFAQSILNATLGVMAPVAIMVPAALVGAALLTRKLAGFVVWLIPRDETSAISERSLGRRRGVITVGTAKVGQPAQVRIQDHYGNFHYAMLEPLSAKDEIPQAPRFSCCACATATCALSRFPNPVSSNGLRGLLRDLSSHPFL